MIKEATGRVPTSAGSRKISVAKVAADLLNLPRVSLGCMKERYRNMIGIKSLRIPCLEHEMRCVVSNNSGAFTVVP